MDRSDFACGSGGLNPGSAAGLRAGPPGSAGVLLPLVMGALTALAWAYLLAMAWGMMHEEASTARMLMPGMMQWRPADLALVFAMWAVMMVAMMLPTAWPMVRTFAVLSAGSAGGQAGRVNSGTPVGSGARWRTTAFVGAYLLVWAGFSVGITLLQWALQAAGFITSMMTLRSPAVAGALLIAAGIYQFTPLKQACLATCRTPLAFLMTEWRPGLSGAWRMGLRHGLLCAGCCWLLMALLFVLGVMNLAWIAVLAAFVLLEKTWPKLRWLSAAGGMTLIIWGIVLLAGIGIAA